MTVGKISATCWAIFVVMCVAFLPLGWVILSIHSLPLVIRAVLAIVVVLGLWWGPFVYAMYLSLAVMRNGDRRLLRRGIAGTAEVLSAKATNTVIQEGEFAWEAPRVYKYRLRVNLPGKAPYETDCSICASGIRQGSVVNVAVSPHNRKRVTIDVGQGSKDGASAPRGVPDSGIGTPSYASYASDGMAGRTGYAGSPRQGQSSDSQRLSMLAQLGQLHSQGVLTDAEFAAQKARILGD